ncbi:thioesterase domain-containing protein [Paenibacillus caseinilyticus]|uniref:thioesterase domain-containing protein n=1 Tax=Paenibacillus caseinilyticus TaxID=3098138 RepID=UPI0022B8BCB9|nr:thioesterase domain-containing protein [Paenibacillus caseinilyticus]MCZ8521615.1 thioesterase domain-containing protein [Paenibacillus caseinilyticus]
MTDFLHYVLSEVKQGRLSKGDAMDLLRQFHGRGGMEEADVTPPPVSPSAPRPAEESGHLLHPLVHRNTSDFNEQRFTSVFTGEEPFWLKDARSGRLFMPEFLHLEMVRTAISFAAGARQAPGLGAAEPQLFFTDVAWADPLAAGEGSPVEVHISLFEQAEGGIAFEVYSPQGTSEEPVVYCQGYAVRDQFEEAAPVLELRTLQETAGHRCRTGAECREAWEERGILYPSSYRSLEKLQAGDGGVLAKLSQPASAGTGADGASDTESIVWESALQAAAWLEGPGSAWRPAALKHLRTYGSFASTAWVWIRESGIRPGEEGGRTVDIDWCGEDGSVTASMRSVVLTPGGSGHGARAAGDPHAAKPSGIMLAPWSGGYDDTGTAAAGAEPSAGGADPADFSPEKLLEDLAASFAAVLDMKRSDVDPEAPFTEVGLDSISGVEWIRDMNKTFGVSVTLAQIHEHPTLRELAGWLSREKRAQAGDTEEAARETAGEAVPVRSEEPAAPAVALSGYRPLSAGSAAAADHSPRKLLARRGRPARNPADAWPQFPELVPLRQGGAGQPVFWIHGGSGTVQAYRTIAQMTGRPFFGIQPRGWTAGRKPLEGLQAMAAYYTHMIQSVQPEGPYDLGGFSLGGRLAYEVTRQLQELGQRVRSIVMLDSYLHTPYRTDLQSEAAYRRTLALQAVNSALLSLSPPGAGSWAEPLIHRDEVVDLREAEPGRFLEELIRLAEERGLKTADPAWRDRVHRSIEVQLAYGLDRYRIHPLPIPEQPSCYYFRCSGGSFYGELEPYFTLSAPEESAAAGDPYWEGWEGLLPSFHLMSVEAASHYQLLSEVPAMDAIRTFCAKLYAGESLPTQSKIEVYS